METYERFKVESGVWLDRCFATEHVNFWNIAAYSHPRLTKRLNKANKAKLEKLMDPATPVDTYIRGVGFKTYYIYDKGCDPFVYVIASEQRELNPADAERETILLRRYDPASFYDKGHNSACGRKWDGGLNKWVPIPHEQAVQHYMTTERNTVQPVYLDRLNKKEREALALLYLLNDRGYIEGVGGVSHQLKFERNLGWINTGERVFFLEKPSKPSSVE
jgi:hypothetical protein